MDEYEIENVPSDFEDILELMNGEEPGEAEDNQVDEDEEENQDPEEDEEEAEEEDEEESDDEADPDDEGDEEDEEEDDDDPEEVVADDTAVVKVTVNGEEKTIPVSDLKRLAGQEAALTQKAQANAASRRQIEAQSVYFANMFKSRFEAAQARANKYKDVDLYQASRELDDEDFNALRTAKEAADAELATIEAEARDFIKTSTETREALLREQAKEARTVLMEKIPEWDDALYTRIRNYAVKQGMDAQAVNEIVDPGAILMIHKALKFDEAQEKASTVEKKVKKAPKRSARKSAKPTNSKAGRVKALKRRASQEGDMDAVAALMDAMSE